MMKWIPTLFLLSACLEGAAEQRPNILWITGEDMSAKWLGCHEIINQEQEP
jgi:hypothetical protein